MEGSEYGSAHLPSPALVVFSQAANGLSEALRIQRPFHSQVHIHIDSYKFFGIKCQFEKHKLRDNLRLIYEENS